MADLSRRALVYGLASTAVLSATPPASAQTGRLGVVLLHGKRDNAGGGLSGVGSAIAGAGMPTQSPDLPWSRGRYLSGSWSEAMAEIGQSVAALRGAGASRVALVGHSMGCPAAMSYAATRGAVAGLVLTAPGHVPKLYFSQPPMRESIERARAMAKSGRGQEQSEFLDNNQGNMFTVQTTASQYLSYFDPSSQADMGNTVGRVSCPVMWVVGTQDGAINWGAPIGRRLTGRPKSRYLEIPGGFHRNTPSLAAGEIVQWLAAL